MAIKSALLLLLPAFVSLAQQPMFKDTAGMFFQEVRLAATMHRALWEYDLNGPILLVNKETREVYSNMPDSLGVLQKENGVYRGYLPKTVNVANTSVRWSGTSWAMVMLPLPSRREPRVNLLMHELFHRAQPDLGFKANNPNNDHLDKKEGRVYLRLEIGALKVALVARGESVMKNALHDALTFRTYRHMIFPGSDSTENLLELNEGVAEFTGLMMSGRNDEETRNHLVASMEDFVKDPSYIRSFAYQTIPAYGYLLSQTHPRWNRQITNSTNLMELFSKTFPIVLPEDVKSKVARISMTYEGEAIEREELAREEKIERQLRKYRAMFVDGPRLDLPLEQMNMSFEYQNITPLDDKGTVYPVIRITDLWGILDVKEGALVSAQWDRVTVTAPTTSKGRIEGDGWTLELNDAYEVRKETEQRYYVAIKKK